MFGANAIRFSLGEKATEGEGGLPQIIYRIHSGCIVSTARQFIGRRCIATVR